jgi:hypothetical protein
MLFIVLIIRKSILTGHIYRILFREQLLSLEQTTMMNDAASYDTARPGSSMRPPLFRRRWFMMTVAGATIMGCVIAIAVSVGGAGGGGGSSRASSWQGAGPVSPAPELPPDEVKNNRNELGSVLVTIYDSLGLPWTKFNDPESAQSKALTWVSGSGTYPKMVRVERIQRYALAVFYYSTFMQPHEFLEQPTGWSSSDKWLTQQSECTWEGIICNTNGNVDSILLPDHYLSGVLPMELAILRAHLTTIDVGKNNIIMKGAANDVFGFLYKLQNLVFDDNYMVTTAGLPESFSELVALKKLSVSYNLLQGQIDGSVIAGMQALEHFEIESNYLSGSLPVQLGQLENLVYLYVRRNDLTMDLNALMAPGNLKSIFALWLDSNSISGRIPTTIGLLTDLTSLSITNSTLSGAIPTEMAKLTKLRRLWLYDNNLSGRIPSEFAALTKLEVVEVYQNNLRGVMPPAVCQAIQSAAYEFSTLSADCGEVQCDNCCTSCY